MAQIPKGRLVKGPYKPICRDCAIYFSTTVHLPTIDCQGTAVSFCGISPGQKGLTGHSDLVFNDQRCDLIIKAFIGLHNALYIYITYI